MENESWYYSFLFLSLKKSFIKFGKTNDRDNFKSFSNQKPDRMTKVLFISICISLLTLYRGFAQTQQDTLYTLYTSTPVVIDGSDADEIWTSAEWHAIDQVWIPYNEVMAAGDFTGKFKVAWDKDYLYILVETEDDMISDDYSTPTDNYWNDDCVELFIDEDRSKGDHQYNNNAFAYHCSIYYDVIDVGSNGNGVNYKNNLSMIMDTIGDNTYRWEFAVKMYDKNFNYSNAEASRVKLSPNKLMGFSIAYCDNDDAANKQRENFIGSMIMTETHANDNYITADYFGSMLLIDPANQYVSSATIEKGEKMFSIYPNPAVNEVQLVSNEDAVSSVNFEIRSVDGRFISQRSLVNQKQTIALNNLSKGLYIIKLTTGNYAQSGMILVQ